MNNNKDLGKDGVKMEINEIEQKIALGELSAAQVFTQMKQHACVVVKVGNFEKKEVSKLNNTIYLKAKDILEERQELSHIGWSGVGHFIDWLEENYNLTEK